jgi:hypothetical protein
MIPWPIFYVKYRPNKILSKYLADVFSKQRPKKFLADMFAEISPSENLAGMFFGHRPKQFYGQGK